MKARKIVIISLILCAVVAACVGLGVYFFGFKNVTEVPNQIEIMKNDGKYMISTTFNPNYAYRFRVEKFLGDGPVADEGFIVMKEIDSDLNYVEIGTEEEFELGETYRFSACFINENKSCGKFFKAQPWSITGQFEAQVDYQTVKFEDDVLSWKKVEGADNYTYVVLNGSQEVLRQTINVTSFSCSELALGQYKVFISAGVDNPLVLSSEYGAGANFKIERQNVISHVEKTGNFLKVTCSQQVEQFQIFVDGALKRTVSAGEPLDGVYTIDISLIDIDFASQKVEISSCACGLYVKESTKVEVI